MFTFSNKKQFGKLFTARFATNICDLGGPGQLPHGTLYLTLRTYTDRAEYVNKELELSVTSRKTGNQTYGAKCESSFYTSCIEAI